MKISYDPEIDALYIRLREGKHECRSVRLSDEVAFNIGVGGRWWHLDTRAIDSFDQLLTYNTDRYGVFVQAGVKLN